MFVQVTFGLECHPTGIASKGPLVRVPPDVFLQYRWFIAVQSTVRTHILPVDSPAVAAGYHRRRPDGFHRRRTYTIRTRWIVQRRRLMRWLLQDDYVLLIGLSGQLVR